MKETIDISRFLILAVFSFAFVQFIINYITSKLISKPLKDIYDTGNYYIPEIIGMINVIINIIYVILGFISLGILIMIIYHFI
mgnify:CR=1 FL=1